jgi:UPF0755 protein
MIKWLLGIFGFILLTTTIVVVVGAWQAYRFWWQQPVSESVAVNFVIAPGSGVSAIADQLETEDLIASAFWFKAFVAMNGEAKNLQAGQYEIKPGLNYSAIVALFKHAETEEITLTIPEGYTLKQIGELVEEKFAVTPEEWASLTGVDSEFETNEFLVRAGKPDHVDLEGYLFPDTYRFAPDATGNKIVDQLLATMEQRLTEADAWFAVGKDQEFQSMHELLTLASILEREVRQPETMKMVSDIFRKRLEIGMALQADSTVNYITGGDNPSVSLADLEIDSPYNTYKYPGLPPGPISNPGINALTAAAYPQGNDYFYFLTDAQGNVYYATTHDEHVANKNRYLR